MEITPNLTCECNGKIYKSSACLKAHHKTNIHSTWQKNKEHKDILIKINKLENDNGHLKRLNLILVDRITDLEKKNIFSPI